MNAVEFLNTVHTLEGLKNDTRHSYTSSGRHESVAEHTYRITLMAFFIRDEFPELDGDKLIRMCLIHDLGEIFTGDIPSFLKKPSDEENEISKLYGWVKSLPEPYRSEMLSLYDEMTERKTLEAKVFKALDNLEAVIQHNEADLSTWSENEFTLNLTYGADKCSFSDYLTQLRKLVRRETEEKIASSVQP